MDITYNDYVNRYNLQDAMRIPEEKFDASLARAACFLRFLSLGRITEDTGGENFAPCVCAVAEILYQDALRGGIAHENNDGYAVTYRGGCAYSSACDIVTLYYGTSGLLYRGCAV